MWGIAWHSLVNRRATAALVVLAIAMSVALILSVEKLRRDARASFAGTVSGTDLVVGARSGSIQLLLYSVFRIGSATNNISVESVEWVRSRESIDWVVPLSLGDSHRGYRVVGTTGDYFERFRHGRDRALAFAEGRPFDDVFDIVLGAEVAEALGYGLGDRIVVAHGTGSADLVRHENQPFSVSGILARTGTPVDRSLHVSLEGIEAMHVDWKGGMPSGEATPADAIRGMDLEPRQVTALLVGLKSRGAVFREQRAINRYREEPLLAVLPGAALQELWSLVGVAETALRAVAGFAVVAGIVNLVSVLVASLGERRREMAILRSVGARPARIFGLLCAESALLGAAGIVAGFVLHVVAIAAAAGPLVRRFGLELAPTLPTATDLSLLAAVFVGAVLAGCLPALGAYRRTLADGMSMRL